MLVCAVFWFTLEYIFLSLTTFHWDASEIDWNFFSQLQNLKKKRLPSLFFKTLSCLKKKKLLHFCVNF